MKQAIILFGHGSREARWIEPFERLAARVRKRLPGIEVRLAFLELLSPDLPAATAELAAAGVQWLRVVPVFIGAGGHVRTDLPALIERLRRQYPTITLECAAAVGEDDEVLEALAAYCARDLP